MAKAFGAQPASQNAAYAAGRSAGYAFALAMLVAGIYYAIKGRGGSANATKLRD